jgi:hypothetical protein
MRRAGHTLTLGLLVYVAAAPVGSAHHSVAGEFDMKRTLHLTGVISKVDWANPHIYVHLAVPEQGGLADWRLETVPVAMMRKAGLSKVLLLGDGQTAKVDAYPARDGTPHLGYMLKITYADGHHYQFAPDTPEPPAK